MASTYSLRFRLNFQAPGDNLNTWGTTLNTGVFQLLEDALAKRVAFALSGPKTLVSANGSGDEARCAFLDVTGGSGGTITAPSVEKLYAVRNGATGDVILTTGAGVTATFKAGEIGWAIGDGTNFRKATATDFGGAQLTSVADPTAPQSAATKAYVDSQTFVAAAGNLPGQAGSAGKALVTDGTIPSWGAVWRPTNLHLVNNTNSTSGDILLATSADVVMGGIYADTTGLVALVNSSGAARLTTSSTGAVTAYSDAGGSNLLATQAFAVAAAVVL